MAFSDSRVLVRRLIVGVLVLIGVWVLFFDTHNLVRRATWTYELHALERENRRLEADLELLEEQLRSVDAPDVVERVAREQYGMRRPGETVYPVAPRD